MPDLFAVKTKINLNENRVGIVTIAHPVEGKALVSSILPST